MKLQFKIILSCILGVAACEESEFSSTQKSKAIKTGDQTPARPNPLEDDQTGVDTNVPGPGLDGSLDGQNGSEFPGTKVAMVGASFEDSTDSKDWGTKDVHVCVRGDFKVDGRNIVSTARGQQKVTVVTQTAAACQHEVYIRILNADGSTRDSVTVSSRNQLVTTSKEWRYGEKLSFSMRPTVDSEPGQCTPLGEILHTSTDVQRIQWYNPGSCPPGL